MMRSLFQALTWASSFRAMSLVMHGVVLTPAIAQSLPITEGIYLTDDELCGDLRKGELDFIDIEVTEGGKAISLPEAFCVIADVKSVRSGRYQVRADCDEAGDVWSYSFFLDVVSRDEIAIDGSTHRLCLLDAHTRPPNDEPWSAEEQELIERWASENQGCRGGSGDDPETMKACDRRTVISERLDDMDMCYGREADGATAAYEWHRCEVGSIRAQ